MCGIVGMITAEPRVPLPLEKALKDLIVMDTVRGYDSTGAFTVGKRTENPGYFKSVCTGPEFVKHSDYRKYILAGDAWATIAHNRAATVGGVDIDTAHPFQEGPITLVHNGTLTSTHTLPKSQYQAGAHNDSQTIAMNLAETEDFKSIIGKLRGAFTLVWFDSRDRALRIVRNDERPMHIAAMENTQSLMLSSDLYILQAAMKRQNIKVARYASLKPGTLLTFKQREVIPTVEEVELGKFQPSYGSGYHVGSRGYHASSPKEPVKAQATVTVLGKRQALPEQLRQMVEEWGQDCTTPLAFRAAYARAGTQKQGRKGGVKTATVLGLVDLEDWGDDNSLLAEIHGLPQGTVERNKDAEWAVRLVGVKYSSGYIGDTVADTVLNEQNSTDYDATEGPKVPIFICRLVSLSYVRPKPKPVIVDAAGNAFVDDVAEDEQQEEHERFIHKKGTGSWLSPRLFREAIESGCINCGGNLRVEDAHEIEWVNNEQDPICMGCVGDLEMMGCTYNQGAA